MSEEQRDPPLSEMVDKGMAFLASHKSPAGETSAPVPAKMVPLYCNNPDTFWAMHYGVTEREFRQWIDDGFMVRCSANNANGRQCRNAARGGHLVYSPNQWVELQGSYCPVHEAGN